MTQNRAFTHTRRITSLHGILLPPKKTQRPKRYITARFGITGTIPSKKNMIWADSNLNLIAGRLYGFAVVRECVDWLKQHLKCFLRNSKKYRDWVEEVKPIIIQQAQIEKAKYEKFGFSYPLDNVTVKVYHYWADNMERDLTNKLDSINDLLVECGIIANDNWQVITRIESEGENYKGEVLQPITTIDITQRIY